MTYLKPELGGGAFVQGTMLWTGAWLSDTNYQYGNVATRASVTYVCLQAHTNQQPPNGTYWAVIS